MKTSRLLTAIGKKAGEIFYTLTLGGEADSMKLDQIIAKFDEYKNSKGKVR